MLLSLFYLFMIYNFYIFQKGNDICTTILVQLLYNFLSHTHIMFLFSLFFFSLSMFLTNEKRKQQNCLKICTKIVVKISLLILKIHKKTKENPIRILMSIKRLFFKD